MLSRFALLSLLIPGAFSIWPAPRSATNGNSTLLLSSSFAISGPANAPQDLQDAISRTLGYLKADQLGRLIVGRGETDSPSFGSAKSLNSLVLSFTGAGSLQSISSEAIAEITTRNDAYSITIPSDGTAATLSANSSLGLFRGLTTFAQLWYTYENTVYALGAPLKIQDNPAFVSVLNPFNVDQILNQPLTALSRIYARYCP
jgi:hexosaminidase